MGDDQRDARGDHDGDSSGGGWEGRMNELQETAAKQAAMLTAAAAKEAARTHT